MRAPSTSAFALVRGRLRREVTKPDDSSYTHWCTRAVYRTVAQAIEDAGDAGATGSEIADAEGLSFTQVHTALAFMVERGCVEVVGRRNFPASDVLLEDAMVELEALAA